MQTAAQNLYLQGIVDSTFKRYDLNYRNYPDDYMGQTSFD